MPVSGIFSKLLPTKSRSSQAGVERPPSFRATMNTTSDSSTNQNADPPVTVAIVGCGQRGRVYARFCALNPSLGRVVALAEPRPEALARLHSAHPHATTFTSWDALLAAPAPSAPSTGGPPRIADAVVVAVQDALHATVVKAFAEKGYHILCEKPMAVTEEGCKEMCDTVEKAGTIFGVGHVLRYSPYNAALVALLRSEELGEIVNITHLEPVGHYHFAHSYVRGNWSKEAESSFGLMTKCCHDLDILLHYMRPAKLEKVSSFGALSHFKREKKPPLAGGVTKCVDCPVEVERACPYSAKKIYLEPVSKGHTGWPASATVPDIPDIESITDALQNSAYGKCVYESDNDIVDNQVVNMQFDNGATASLTMVAFTTLICERITRIHCSHGEIIGNSSTLTITSFKSSPPTTRTLTPTSSNLTDDASGSHGGGDMGLMRTFVKAVREGKQEVLGVTAREALESHLAVFAAERSRREGRVVEI